MIELTLPDIESANKILDIVKVSHETVLDSNGLIDEVEFRIMQLSDAEFQGRAEQISFLPLKHRFTPGMYIREIFMPAGKVLTSQVHKTEHPFVISKGKALVYLNRENGWKELVAPHSGTTFPGSRRILLILEDMIWTSFHPNPTDTTDLVEIEKSLSADYINPLLPSEGYRPVVEAMWTKENKQ